MFFDYLNCHRVSDEVQRDIFTEFWFRRCQNNKDYEDLYSQLVGCDQQVLVENFADRNVRFVLDKKILLSVSFSVR